MPPARKAALTASHGRSDAPKASLTRSVSASTAASKRARTAPKQRANKISIPRLSKIVRMVRKKGVIPMRSFVQELEVSEKTVKRDIEFLLNRLGCPLNYDRKRGGWVMDDDGQFELPGVWFEASDVFALLMMLRLVRGVQPGLLEEHLGHLETRLQRMLAAGTSKPSSIERKVKLIHFAPRKVEPKHFQVLASALLDGKKLHIKYWVRERQELTERTISPQQLVHYRENWLLDAWCHQREALRSFALETIREVRVLDEPGIEVSEQDMRDHFQSGYGIFAGKAEHRAVMKFTPRRAEEVALENWHPDQTSQTLNDGSYVLEVPYSNDKELVSDLMRHGEEVEVLAPPELRRKVAEALCAAAEKYIRKPAH
jgi:predicted DNA-binding transcriptional regulator YafY